MDEEVDCPDRVALCHADDNGSHTGPALVPSVGEARRRPIRTMIQCIHVVWNTICAPLARTTP